MTTTDPTPTWLSKRRQARSSLLAADRLVVAPEIRVVSAPIRAQHPGWCRRCNTYFPSGTWIYRASIGDVEGWVHDAGCPSFTQIAWDSLELRDDVLVDGWHYEMRGGHCESCGESLHGRPAWRVALSYSPQAGLRLGWVCERCVAR